MTLSEYISKHGDAVCAKLWAVKVRTVRSWREKRRTPRKAQAQKIVATTTVTFEGIYGR